MNFEQLLQKIMEKDSNIRHCIVADSEGNIKSVNHREGITNYLSEDETAASLKRAASAWKARKQLENKIGPGTYAVAAFEKITRITFPLGQSHLLFVSMGSQQVHTDVNAGGVKDVIDKVLHTIDGDPTTE